MSGGRGVEPVTAGLPFDDPAGAFFRENHVALEGAASGPLSGLSFAVKDVFHIAGHRTGFGSPEWLATHEPAAETAAVVRRLLDAGARMAGAVTREQYGPRQSASPSAN